MHDLAPPRRTPLFLLAGLLALPVTTLTAQQPAVAASSTAVPATTAPAPAPHPSPLFEQPSHDTTTLASAEQAHREALKSSNHTFTVSTAVIVLSAVIVILLVA